MTSPLGEVANPDVVRALAEIVECREPYEAAREYDSINLLAQFDTTREGATLRQAGIEYDPNFCAPVINSVSDGLVIESITAVPMGTNPDDPELDVDSEAGTALVNAIWHANKLDQFWPDWERNSLRDGDGYIMVWPKLDIGPIGQPRGEGFTPEEICITYVDPTMGRIFYDPADPRVALFFGQLWNVPSRGDRNRIVWRLNLVYGDRIERYITEPMSPNGKLDPNKFKPFEESPDEDGQEYDSAELDDDGGPTWPEPNPYGFPVFHARTKTPYGEPVHANAFGPQDAISELIHELMTTVKFQGWPQTYALQEADNLGNQMIREDPLAESYRDVDDYDDDRVSLTTLPDGAEISNEQGTGIESTPGGMMLFKKFKEVGQFVAADPNVFLDPWREMAKAVADTTATPPWAFRAIGAEIPSGVALKIASQPQTRKRERCALLFGAMLRDALAFGAELCGVPDLLVTVKWAPFEVVDEKERWELVELRTRAGVPFEHALMMAGIPERQALEWAAERKTRQAEEFARQAELASKAPPGGPPGDDE